MYRLVEWRTDSKGILGTVITENRSIVNELDSKQIKEVRYVEDEFPMRFKEEGIKSIPQVENKYLLVYTGKISEDKWIQYDMRNNEWIKKKRGDNSIVVLSSDPIIRSSRYLKCIIDMIYEVTRKKEVLVLYNDIFYDQIPDGQEIYVPVATTSTISPAVYKGEGVYIGVLGIDGVDYKNPLLLDRDNKTRLAYVWEQIAVDENEMLSTNVKLEF